MSRQLKPLNRRRGYHQLSRVQRRRIKTLLCDVALMNACAKAYVRRGQSVPMMVQHILSDIVVRFGRVSAELRGLSGSGALHLVGIDLCSVLFNPPTF